MTIGKSGLLGCFLALTVVAAGSLPAQTGNQSSATNSYYGSVTAVPPVNGVVPLTLDDAIRLGLENNLALTLARDQQKTASGQRLEALNGLLPTITLQGQNGVHQYNLEAEGFRGQLLSQFPVAPTPGETFNFVPTVTVTQGQLNLNLNLLNVSVIDQYRAAKAGESAAFYNMQSSRGLVVLNVGTAYLQALAASSQLDYARALLKTDEVALNQAVAEHEAGTAAKLDELRARVQYQTQQQTVIAQENSFEKAKIALEREIGMPAGQNDSADRHLALRGARGHVDRAGETGGLCQPAGLSVHVAPNPPIAARARGGQTRAPAHPDLWRLLRSAGRYRRRLPWSLQRPGRT